MELGSITTKADIKLLEEKRGGESGKKTFRFLR
jgi:hypothetical protein